MSSRHDIEITDHALAVQAAPHIRLGHAFAFCSDAVALPPRRGRQARLTAYRDSLDRAVVPLVGDSVELKGVRITPSAFGVTPLAALVCDRDLYRAERDTVHLFIATPGSRDDVRLVVEHNGAAMTERDVEMSGRPVAIETLSMLLPGRYTARLDGLDREVTFTVAEYTLAPLSGRLVQHELDRGTNELKFVLAVDSYQVDLDERLTVSLIEDSRQMSQVELHPAVAGRFEGALAIDGDGPLSLRLSVTDDPSRVAEVAIPGSRATERATTVISELGQEVLLSLLPERGALEVRGAYLTEGDNLSTPLVVEDVLTDVGEISVRTDVQCLSLVVVDLATGVASAVLHGAASAGEVVEVVLPGPMCVVSVGCFVKDAPFEAYTTFIRQAGLTLDVGVPERVRPRQTLEVSLKCSEDSPVDVLLAVRDQRLVATDRPLQSLAASAKAGVEAWTAGMDTDEAFVSLRSLITPQIAPAGGGWQAYEVMPDAEMSFDDGVVYAHAPSLDMMEGASAYEATGGYEVTGQELQSILRLGGEARSQGGLPKGDSGPGGAPSDPRSVFPEVLFYAIVSVHGEATIEIELSDSLTTYAVEAFALTRSDWVAASAAVVVDQPVRVDLDMPDAVHLEDHVVGTLRAVAPGRVQVELTRDDRVIELEGQGAHRTFRVRPGQYRARVVDVDSGDSDELEVTVAEPGRFRTAVKTVKLLSKGDSVTLDSEDALTLRVMPALDDSFAQLVEATACYEHLCCEQTAAKIVSAVFMYMAAEQLAARQVAEQIIVAGIEREKQMWLRGRGFRMYPGSEGVSAYYSPLTTRYLWSLYDLVKGSEPSPTLSRAIGEGLDMAADTARAHGLERVPTVIDSIDGAFAAAGADRSHEVMAYLESEVDVGACNVRVQMDPVSKRRTLGYAAAILLRLGRSMDAIGLANEVMKALNAEGRLYSTVDSIAAIALLGEIRSAGLLAGAAKVRANGTVMSLADAVALADQIETVEVVDGTVAVQVTRIVEEDWSSFDAQVGLRVGFHDDDGQSVRRFARGDRAHLDIELTAGYREGDLVHVSLPPAMMWIKGGGRVRQFSVDFAGANKVRIPIVVMTQLSGPQHYSLCVRNMFEEARATSPGLLRIEPA